MIFLLRVFEGFWISLGIQPGTATFLEMNPGIEKFKFR